MIWDCADRCAPIWSLMASIAACSAPPSLRNVAIRRLFFHNGVVHRLEDAVRFYAERDTHPEKWYPRTSGVIRVFDDLPAEYHANVDRIAPFDRRPGDPPALSTADVAAIVDFLKTLTDGYAVGSR